MFSRGREIGEFVERVDRADVDRARIADEQKRTKPLRAIVGDDARDLAGIEAVQRIRRQDAQRSVSEPRDFERSRDASVRRARRVPDEPFGTEESVFADGRPERARARDQHGQEVRRRRPDGDDAAGFRRHAEEIAKPADDLSFYIDGSVIASSNVRIHRSGKQFGERARRRSAAVDPSEETRVNVAGRVRQYVADELAVHVVERRGVERHRRTQPFANVLRHLLPDGPLAHVLEVVDGVVERGMTQRTKRVPVLRIEDEGTLHSRKR